MIKNYLIELNDLPIKTDQAIEKIKSFADVLRLEAETISIVDQSTLNHAGNYRNSLSVIFKAVDSLCDPGILEQRQALSKLQETKKSIESIFQPLDDSVRDKIKKYLVDQDQLKREAAKMAQEAQKAAMEKARENRFDKAVSEGKLEKAEALLNADLPITPMNAVAKSASESQIIVDNWKAEIIDPTLIPAEYMIYVPDIGKINKVVKAVKGNIFISGIRVFNDIITRRKSNK